LECVEDFSVDFVVHGVILPADAIQVEVFARLGLQSSWSEAVRRMLGRVLEERT
jgi:hypothetical protein